MFIDRRRMEGRALRQECYVIQKTDNLYAAAKHSTADGVRKSMLLPIYKHATPDGVRPLMNLLELHFYHCIL